MSKCCNDVLLKNIGIEKLKKKTKLTFNILYSFPDCRVINTRNVIEDETVGTAVYNGLEVPEDVLECARNVCINTGTLTVTPEANASAQAVFKAPFDMTELAAGLMTFYTKTDGNITVEISSTVSFENADQYVVNANDLASVVGNAIVGQSTVGVNSDNFKIGMVDLSSEPDNVIGTGWTPSQSGAFIRFVSATDEVLSLSSIFFFESVEDLELNHVIEFVCLTGWEGEDTVDADEVACFTGGYDSNSVDGGLERTITGHAITPNYWMLNPLMRKNVPVTSYMPCDVEKTIVENGDYGEVTLIDKFEDECGYLGVQLVKPCSVAEATLIRVDVPMNAEIDEKHFAVYTNEDGTTTLRFSKNLVGEDVRITYPREMKGEVVEISKFNIENAPRVRVTREVQYTDGDIGIFQYDNVLVTSFSDNVNEDDWEFSVTINIRPDENGRFGRLIRVTK